MVTRTRVCVEENERGLCTV